MLNGVNQHSPISPELLNKRFCCHSEEKPDFYHKNISTCRTSKPLTIEITV